MATPNDPAAVEKILASIPAESREWMSPAGLELVANLPLDFEARVKAITGSLAHCRTNTADYLRRKHAEIEEECDGD